MFKPTPFKSRITSGYNFVAKPNDAPRASPECIERCKILNGSDAVSVAEELDDGGSPTGWVAIFGSNNRASQLLISLPPPHSNEAYLETVKHCADTNACQNVCPLTSYTLEAYVKRGEINT